MATPFKLGLMYLKQKLKIALTTLIQIYNNLKTIIMKTYKFTITDKDGNEVNTIVKQNLTDAQATSFESLLLDSIPFEFNVTKKTI